MGIVKSVGNTIGSTVGSLTGGVFGGVAGGLASATPAMSNTQRQYYSPDVTKYRDMANDATYQQYLQNLNAQLTGHGPSVADLYAQQAGQQSVANANAIAASARGNVNPAMALRSAQTAGAQGQQQAMQQGALMKQQEALNAMQMAQQNRQQNLGMEQFYQDLGMKGDAGYTQNQTQFAGAGMQALSGAASAAAMSDERVKTSVKDGSNTIQEFLDKISPNSYEYKNKDFGEGEHVSPMAQELERHPIGESMVMDTPQGKMVDYGKGFGAILAAQADLHERMKQLEKKKNG